MGIGDLSPWHLLILAAVVLVLFGAKKLPDSARSLGRAMRIFKAETQGLRGDGGQDDAPPQSPVSTPVQQISAAPTPAPPPPAPEPPAAPVSIRMEDGTVVTGVPLPKQHTSQPS